MLSYHSQGFQNDHVLKLRTKSGYFCPIYIYSHFLVKLRTQNRYMWWPQFGQNIYKVTEKLLIDKWHHISLWPKTTLFEKSQWPEFLAYISIVTGVCLLHSKFNWSSPFKKVVRDMGLNCSIVLIIKFYNKSWADKGCQMIYRRSSALQRTT